ncbi:hypothetical protein A1353_13330 [Methylomonas methanica]|uniref:DUF1963 domain-containing protein n=1 Tax=Methylomonas methanica TaxID=421 RepID=A0A177MHS3_METMH|nr:hypothetical protein A1353_13330 [Methylomonas methanica]
MFKNLLHLVTRLLKHKTQKVEHTNHEDNTDIVSILESQASVASIVKQISNEKAVIEPAIRFLSERRPGIWLDRRLPRDFEHPTNSYLGGIPGLSAHSDWPYDNKGRRAFFVGQLDCREINDLLPGYLPDAGMLCFFVDQDMENFCKADDIRKCYVIHVVNDGKPIINSAPDDYPNTGDWFGALEGLSFRYHSLEDRELQPRVWPKADLKPHKIATFDSSYDYRKSLFPSAEQNAQQRALWESFDTILDKVENDYMAIKQDSILGPKVLDDSYLYKLFPKTVPAYFQQYKDRPYSSFGLSFPWTRLHISRTIQSVLCAAREEFNDVKRWHFSELSEMLELDRRFSKKYSWGYGGIRDTPDLIRNTEELQALSASIEASHPELWNRFRYWLELEQFYQEASALYESYADNPFTEPSDNEKEQFVDWLAGWINLGCARSDKRLAELLGEKSFPVFDTGFDLPEVDKGNNSLRFYTFFSSRLQSACHSAFCDASIMCLSHSAALSELIPKETFESLLLLPAYDVRYGFHRCLGYGTCVQRAAYRHRDKVLLLEVRSDKALFTNFGDGALQFWITPEDLAARRFDQAFVTAECT